MLKHRGFPSRLPGTDHQFTIRRANKAGATPLRARKRHADRRSGDRAADAGFLAALIAHFGDTPFARGNLDAGRLSWLLDREVVAAEPDAFHPEDYEALLRVDLQAARRGFPELFSDDTPWAEDLDVDLDGDLDGDRDGASNMDPTAEDDGGEGDKWA